MANNPSPFPGWLQKAERADYLADVYQVLYEREAKRRDARQTSIHTTHSSTTHRIIHKPATVFKNTDLANHYSVSHGSLPPNQPSNRYRDVTPYDRTRVVVGHYGSEPAGRYLNASWVRELAGKKWWIATQAPLPGTVHAFLSLILQPVVRPLEQTPGVPESTGPISRIRTVVQLTRVRESGSLKAHFYFPQTPGESWISDPEPGCSAPPLKVTLIDTKVIDKAGCVHSIVSIQPVDVHGQPIQETGDPVVFNHLFFEGWPDHDVPENPEALLHFVHLVDQVNRDTSSQSPDTEGRLDPDPPIMVGCSAGIGRTGTFIALASILRAHRFLPTSASLVHDSDAEVPELSPSPLGDLPDEFKDDMVAQEVDALREQRPGMVQKSTQMKLIYEALVGLLSSGDVLPSSTLR